MPLRKFRAAMSKRLDDTRDAAQQKIPAEQLLNQIAPANLGPRGNTGAGYTPAAHAASHEDGGADAIDLGSLAGELTDAQHGDRGGGALHDAATGSVAGFMSAADKALLDALPLPSYLTLALSGTLSNERRIVAGTGITLTDGGAGGDLTIDATGGGGSGTVTSVALTAPAAGLTFTGGPITTSGAITAALANDLAALEALSSTGIAVRSATDTWLQRSIAGTSNRVSVANGGGVAGDPTIDISASYVGQTSITTLGTITTGTWSGSNLSESQITGLVSDLSALSAGIAASQPLDGDLTAIAALSSTGLAARTAANTWAQRTITGTASRLSVTNGDGVSGNPTLNIDTGYVGQSSITTLGTIGTGTWQATLIAPAYGGTGTANTGNLAWPSGGGTAALRGVANTFTATQTIAATLDSQQLTRVRTTASGNGYGIRFWDGTNDFAAFQSLDLGGTSYMFFATNRQFDGSAWQQLNTRVGGDIQLTGDIFNYYTFPVSSSTPVLQMSMSSTGIFNARVGYSVAGTQVVDTRRTGWAVATGTATRTTFDTASVTLPQLAQRLKALIDDLHATAGHGLIGT